MRLNYKGSSYAGNICTHVLATCLICDERGRNDLTQLTKYANMSNNYLTMVRSDSD